MHQIGTGRIVAVWSYLECEHIIIVWAGQTGDQSSGLPDHGPGELGGLHRPRPGRPGFSPHRPRLPLPGAGREQEVRPDAASQSLS